MKEKEEGVMKGGVYKEYGMHLSNNVRQSGSKYQTSRSNSHTRSSTFLRFRLLNTILARVLVGIAFRRRSWFGTWRNRGSAWCNSAWRSNGRRASTRRSSRRSCSGITTLIRVLTSAYTNRLNIESTLSWSMSAMWDKYILWNHVYLKSGINLDGSIHSFFVKIMFKRDTTLGVGSPFTGITSNPFRLETSYFIHSPVISIVIPNDGCYTSLYVRMVPCSKIDINTHQWNQEQKQCHAHGHQCHHKATQKTQWVIKCIDKHVLVLTGRK